MPIRQDIADKAIAVIADAIFVKDDLAIAGIHHAICADLVS